MQRSRYISLIYTYSTSGFYCTMTSTTPSTTTQMYHSNEWYIQHLSNTLKQRDARVLWNDDEHEAYYEIAQRAQADRCQCYRLIATGRTLLQLTKMSPYVAPTPK